MLGPDIMSNRIEFLETIPTTPIFWLTLEKRPDCAQVTFMAKEISFLCASRPEFDSVRKCVHSLTVAPDE